MTTKNLELKTQQSASPASGRECRKCVYATKVWNGRPDELVCANHPDHAGQLAVVACGGVSLPDVGQRCRRFRVRLEPDVTQELPATNGQLRHIALAGGLFAIVDAADFEWLNRHRWQTTGGTTGYVRSTIRGKNVFMHRLIMNPPAGMVVDHINGNRQDNRRGNLRVCTQAENLRNRRSCRGTSRFKGVHWNAKIRKWVASICLNRKIMHLGYFDDEIEAARAYDRKARELFGPFAYLNFPGPARIVLLSGRIEARSCVRGQIQIVKSEVRMSKLETNSNHQIPKFKTTPRSASAFRSLEHLSFEIVSDFEFRASCLSNLMTTGPPDGDSR